MKKCHSCPRPVAENRARCSQCLLTTRQAQNEKYRSLVKAGLCGGCGQQPPEMGKAKCRPCLDKYNEKARSPKARAREQAYHKKYYANTVNSERRNAGVRRRWAALRDEIYGRYGKRCGCCGETTPEFLSIDHKNGDGAAHRRQIFNNTQRVSGGNKYMIAIRDDPDQSRYWVLCFNCNMSRGLRGYCPHQPNVISCSGT